MPPRVKFQKKDIVEAAFETVRKKGAGALTAREVADALGVSTRPIFTWFDAMDELRAEVYELTKARYREYIERGLEAPVPFLGVWQQYIRFAREEPELYKLLYLTKPDGVKGGAMDSFRFSRELVRDSVMRVYNMDAPTADSYFRDLWLAAFGFAALIVTDDCPYTDEEIFSTGAEISLSICKAYKEIPGLPKGDYDKEAIFKSLVSK